MSDLAEWLLEQIAEDENIAGPFRTGPDVARRWQCDDIGGIVRDVGPMPWGLTDVISKSDTHVEAKHIATWNPARVLAECDAKRRIVDYHRPDTLPDGVPTYDPPRCESCENWELPCPTLRLLASPYADRTGYRQEWRPE